MSGPTAALLLTGLLAGQPPQPGGIGPDDVRRLAGRLAQLDPAAFPNPPLDLAAIKKLLDANPELKAAVERQAADFQQLTPAEQARKLADLRAATGNPQLRSQIDALSAQLGRRTPDRADARPPQGQPADRPPPDRRPPGRSPQWQPERTPPAEPPQPAEPPRRAAQQEVPDAPPDRPVDRPSPPRPAEAGRPAPGGLPPGGNFDRFARFWESNVGPLKDMPAVQQLARELLRGRPDGSAGGDGGPLAGLIDPKTAANLLKNLPDPDRPGGWQVPEVGGLPGGLPRPTLPQPSFGPPEAPSAGSMGVAAVAVAVIGLAVAAVLLWPRLRLLAGGPTPVPGLGPWPLDPRAVTSRADLVRAFEYLSVLVNGDPARTYSHEAAAAALRAAVPQAADAAGPLADAYALARYTPADVPLAADDIAAARRHLCRLAGVPAA